MTRPLPTTATVMKQIRRLRVHTGYSCRTLAEYITAHGYTITGGQLNRYEMGRGAGTAQAVSVDFAAAAALALGVRVDDLLDDGPCRTCSDAPPAGFTCNMCGLGLPDLDDIRQTTPGTRRPQ